MRSKILSKLMLIFLAGPLALAAQDTLLLTLDDALMIAHSQSPDAMIAKHKFRMSYWQYRSFKADYLPGINLDATLPGFSRQFRQIPQPDGPDIFQYNTIGDYTMALSIDQKVGWTGGSVFLRTDLERLDNYYPDSILTSFQSTPIVVGYSQPIFQYNEYRWAKRLEPLKYEKPKGNTLKTLKMFPSRRPIISSTCWWRNWKWILPRKT